MNTKYFYHDIFRTIFVPYVLGSFTEYIFDSNYTPNKTILKSISFLCNYEIYCFIDLVIQLVIISRKESVYERRLHGLYYLIRILITFYIIHGLHYTND